MLEKVDAAEMSKKANTEMAEKADIAMEKGVIRLKCIYNF
jgi:hypothetical protein